MLDNFKEKYLFLRLKRKDKDAFVMFYDLYFDRIYRYIYFKVGDKEQAEDITSAFFAKLWNIVQEGKIEAANSFKAYIYTIARNMVLDHFRKNSSAPVEYIEDGCHPDAEGGSRAETLSITGARDLESEMDIKLELERIKSSLLELKDEYREVIILRYMEGLSVSETAKALEKNKSNVKVIAHRALKALNSILEKNQEKNEHKNID